MVRDDPRSYRQKTNAYNTGGKWGIKGIVLQTHSILTPS